MWSDRTLRTGLLASLLVTKKLLGAPGHTTSSVRTLLSLLGHSKPTCDPRANARTEEEEYVEYADFLDGWS